MKRTALAALMLAIVSPAAEETVTLHAGNSNKFVADIVLNNQLTVRGLLDIGATSLTICGHMADALDLPRGEEIVLRTVGKDLLAHRARVSAVRIGPIKLQAVEAVVLADDHCDPEVLIGMSVLHRLRLTMDGGKLILRPGRTKR
jgi:aspartyl protease family protein